MTEIPSSSQPSVGLNQLEDTDNLLYLLHHRERKGERGKGMEKGDGKRIGENGERDEEG